MSRPVLMAHDGGWRSRLLRIWQQYEAIALECTFHHPDDKGETSFELSLPAWPWRWVCLLAGHSDNTYGGCVICRKALP
jgi:hypothetical protein